MRSVVGKLTQKAVDAGFVYRSDVAATDGKLTAITLPARVSPPVAYGAGVVAGTDHAKESLSTLPSESVMKSSVSPASTEIVVKLVSAPPIGAYDIAPVRDRHVSNAKFETVALAVAISIVEDDTRSRLLIGDGESRGEQQRN